MPAPTNRCPGTLSPKIGKRSSSPNSISPGCPPTGFSACRPSPKSDFAETQSMVELHWRSSPPARGADGVGLRIVPARHRACRPRSSSSSRAPRRGISGPAGKAGIPGRPTGIALSGPTARHESRGGWRLDLSRAERGPEFLPGRLVVRRHAAESLPRPFAGRRSARRGSARATGANDLGR